MLLRTGVLVSFLGIAFPLMGWGAEAALTFELAWQLTQEGNPTIRAAGFAVDAARGREQQAGAIANPEFSVEVENIDGPGTENGLDAVELTYALSQPVETGGKRGARLRQAGAERRSTEAASETRKLDVWRRLVESYAAVLADQERVSLAAENTRVVAGIQSAIDLRAQAGHITALETKRAAVETALARIEQARAETLLLTSRRRLAALWGLRDPEVGLLQGRLGAVSELPLQWLAATTGAPPEFQSVQHEVDARSAALNWAQRLTIPDVTLAAGMKDFRETGEQAFVAGVSMPLPLFNWNRGGRAEALGLLRQAEQELRAVELAWDIDRTVLSASIETSQKRLATLKDQAVPAAREALAAAKTGYEQGKFSYMELLDAERSFIAVHTQYLDEMVAHVALVAEAAARTGNIQTNPFETK